MVREVVLGLLIVAALASAGTSASAQTAAPEPAVAPSKQAPPSQQAPPEASAPPAAAAADAPREAVAPGQTRFQVRAMEGILEESVVQAARRLNGQLRKVSPDLVQLTGAARARGYQLEGYGMFFDVEVPAAMRHTMGVTLRMLRQSNSTWSRRDVASSAGGVAIRQVPSGCGDGHPSHRAAAAAPDRWRKADARVYAIIGGSVWAASGRESKVSASSAPAEAPAATSENPPAQQPAPEGDQALHQPALD